MNWCDMGTSKLTRRQSEIYRYFLQYWRATTFWPTIREVGDRFGIRSPNGVISHFRALESKGYLEHVGNRWRAAHR